MNFQGPRRGPNAGGPNYPSRTRPSMPALFGSSSVLDSMAPQGGISQESILESVAQMLSQPAANGFIDSLGGQAQRMPSEYFGTTSRGSMEGAGFERKGSWSCQSCGRNNDSALRACGNCGTLIINQKRRCEAFDEFPRSKRQNVDSGGGILPAPRVLDSLSRGPTQGNGEPQRRGEREMLRPSFRSNAPAFSRGRGRGRDSWENENRGRGGLGDRDRDRNRDRDRDRFREGERLRPTEGYAGRRPQHKVWRVSTATTPSSSSSSMQGLLPSLPALEELLLQQQQLQLLQQQLQLQAATSPAQALLGNPFVGGTLSASTSSSSSGNALLGNLQRLLSGGGTTQGGGLVGTSTDSSSGGGLLDSFA